MPLTGGFFGKFYIFKAALDSHLVWLTVLGLLNSAVAAYYYLRILVMMYMHEPSEAADDVGAALARLPHRAAAARARHAVPGHLPHLGAGFRRQVGNAGEVGRVLTVRFRDRHLAENPISLYTLPQTR